MPEPLANEPQLMLILFLDAVLFLDESRLSLHRLALMLPVKSPTQMRILTASIIRLEHLHS